MGKELIEKLTKLNEKPHNIFTEGKFMKKDGKDIGDRCIREKKRRLGFSEKDRKRIGKNHMMIMYKRIIGAM